MEKEKENLCDLCEEALPQLPEEREEIGIMEKAKNVKVQCICGSWAEATFFEGVTEDRTYCACGRFMVVPRPEIYEPGEDDGE